MDTHSTKPIVGQFANSYGYSDITPFEILSVTKGGGKITIRMMEAQLSPSFKPKFAIGGFSAHCENNGEQKWVISPDPTNGEFSATRCKDGTYSSVFGRHKIEDTPRKFYDYNF